MRFSVSADTDLMLSSGINGEGGPFDASTGTLGAR